MNFWDNVQNLVYHSWVKLLSVIGYTIWYFTNKRWWRYSLLVPITFSFYQFSSVVNDNVRYYDDFEYLDSWPLNIPVIIVLILSTVKLRNKKDSLNILDDLEALKKEREVASE